MTFEFEYPDNLRYTESHEYVRLEGEIATIGISSFAIRELGDIVFFELPKVGDTIVAGEPIGTVESVKAVAELYAPVSGTVTAQHGDVVDDPALVMDDPYDDGWLFQVRVDNPDTALAGTLGAGEYRARVEGEG
ncbi:glycine cleavage system protein GcvH [Pannus brasiliensis CCIBt3594]|uniref:Glycine cleavage system H protein n=1 Tax=Pannus brasiliensis CCIBt3594 TaxID=1427578 RepID=A0AAW9QZ67_9CHRO